MSRYGCHSERARNLCAKHVKSTRSVFLPRRSALCLLTFLLIAANLPAAVAQEQDAANPTLLIQTADGAPVNAFYADIAPGERDEIQISLAVVSDDPVEVELAIANATATPNGGFAPSAPDEPLTDPATWLDLATDRLTLETGESVVQTIEIAVPSTAEPGQYVAAVTLTATEPVSIPGGDGIAQVARSTAAIAITVPGDFEAGFDLGYPTVVQTGSGAFVQIPVENTGTVPVHPQGSLTLESTDGDETAIPVTMGAVFAGSSTVVEISLPSTIAAGDYRLALDLTDADTRASATIDEVALVIPEPPPGSRDPEPFDATPDAVSVSFDRVRIQPEGAPLESVGVEIEIANVGSPIPAATLTLEALRNGQLVEEVVIADGIALADGVTGFTTTYAPEGGYGSGLWTFRVRLDAIADDGTVTLLIQSGTVAKIDVP